VCFGIKLKYSKYTIFPTVIYSEEQMSKMENVVILENSFNIKIQVVVKR